MNTDLDVAYRSTSYTVSALRIRIGDRNEELDRLLRCNRKSEWVYLTAWNPDSQQQKEEDNQAANQRLLERLQDTTWIILPGWGIGDDEDWPPEASYLVLGCDVQAGRQLAKEFGQKAFLYGREQDIPELIYTEHL